MMSPAYEVVRWGVGWGVVDDKNSMVNLKPFSSRERAELFREQVIEIDRAARLEESCK